VVRLVIDMHETPIDIRKLLDLVLEILRNVVSSPKRHVSVHDNIDFDKVVRSRMINPARVDLLDGGIEGHCLRI